MDAETNEPVNIGNPAEMSINKIAEEIIRAVGSSSKIVHKQLPVDDPKVRQPDITRAKTLLGWSPQVSLKDGLNTTIDDFRKRVVRHVS